MCTVFTAVGARITININGTRAFPYEMIPSTVNMYTKNEVQSLNRLHVQSSIPLFKVGNVFQIMSENVEGSSIL